MLSLSLFHSKPLLKCLRVMEDKMIISSKHMDSAIELDVVLMSSSVATLSLCPSFKVEKESSVFLF